MQEVLRFTFQVNGLGGIQDSFGSALITDLAGRPP
jgi:hypothetical protein